MGQELKPAPRKPFSTVWRMPREAAARRKIVGLPAEIKGEPAPVTRRWS